MLSINILNQITKLFFALVFTLFFTACSSSKSFFEYSKNKQKVLIGKNLNETFTLELTKPSIKYYSSAPCVSKSYTINDLNMKYGRVFIEYISLNNNCYWKALPLSFFERNLRTELNIKKLKTLESYDIDSYLFKTYRVDDKFYLNLIYNYESKAQKFILDFDGKLYKDLLKKFKSDYSKDFSSKKRFQGNYNGSLAKKSLRNRYFEEERVE